MSMRVVLKGGERHPPQRRPTSSAISIVWPVPRIFSSLQLKRSTALFATYCCSKKDAGLGLDEHQKGWRPLVLLQKHTTVSSRMSIRSAWLRRLRCLRQSSPSLVTRPEGKKSQG